MLCADGKPTTDMDLFAELSSFPAIAHAVASAPLGTQALVELAMVLEGYTVKRARDQIRRFKELLLTPPEMPEEAADSESAAAAAAQPPQTQAEAEAAAEAEQLKEAKAQQEAAHRLKQCSIPVAAGEGLGAFYTVGLGIDENAVLRPSAEALAKAAGAGSSSSTADPHKDLRDSVRVSLGAWNPPPALRRLRGDLLYAQVVTPEDGTLHLTCVSSGFYVNRTTEGRFDPSPAATPHLSHELLYCLLSASPR